MNKKNILVAVAVVVLAGGTFYGGMAYGKTRTAASFQQMRGNFQGGNRGGAQGGAPISGEILSKDDKSITLKSRDGGSKIVFLSDSTMITKSVAATLDDLAVGTNVSVMGKAGSDGTVSAQSIQIRPAPIAAKAEIGADGVKTFTVSEGNFFFNPSEIRVKKGDKVKINFNDADGMHDFVIDELNLKTKRINAGEDATVEFTADTVGQYAFYCSVGQHRVNGMEGKFIVE